jgi:hypothetical protein
MAVASRQKEARLNTVLTRLAAAGIIAAGVLAVASPARADGCYIPARAVQKIPTIPAQGCAGTGPGTLAMIVYE